MQVPHASMCLRLVWLVVLLIGVGGLLGGAMGALWRLLLQPRLEQLVWGRPTLTWAAALLVVVVGALTVASVERKLAAALMRRR